MHFIPTYSSWLNQVGQFFGLFADKAIRRDSFKSVRQLIKRIDHFVQNHNANANPSGGQLPQSRPLPSWNDFVHVTGQDTRTSMPGGVRFPVAEPLAG